MAMNTLPNPKFHQYQLVSFVGGVGIILSSRPDAGTWAYAVEMEKGPKPSMGRIGAETTILMHEADIKKVNN